MPIDLKTKLCPECDQPFDPVMEDICSYCGFEPVVDGYLLGCPTCGDLSKEARDLPSCSKCGG